MDQQPDPTDPPPLTNQVSDSRLPLGKLAASLGMVLVVAVFDYLTGIEISVTLLYLVPICWCAWFAGRGAGVFVAVVSAGAWLGAEWLERWSIIQPWVVFWNTLMMGGIFVVVAILLATLKATQANLEATVARRTTKLVGEVTVRRRAEGKLRLANTELQRTQMQLIEAAKMEAVGRMAAGVAHEVKNPLMTLGMGVDYFLQRPISDADDASLLHDMKHAVLRGTKIINLMLDFSKPRPLQPSPEDLNAIVENALGLVRHQLLKHRIEVVRQLQAGLPMLPLDHTHMEHVLVNLFTNAAHAMSDGGTLTVRSSLQAATDASIALDPQIILEVEDTGPGIPQEQLPNIFEPFHTTKPPGQGTGLGLAIVHRIIQIHGGSVTLGNRPEGGARATLTFNLQPKPHP